MSVRSSNLSPFRDAVVAAGADGMERRVRRALLGDDAGPSAPRRCRASSSSRRPRRSRPPARTGQQLVARLDAAQVAGLAVRLDPWDRLPAELRAAADRLGAAGDHLPRRRRGRRRDRRRPRRAARQRRGSAWNVCSRSISCSPRSRSPAVARRRSRPALHDLLGCPVAVLRCRRQHDRRRPPGRRSSSRRGCRNRGPPADSCRRPRVRRDRRVHRWRSLRRRPARTPSNERRWQSRCDSLRRAPSRKPRSGSPRSPSKSSSPGMPATPPTWPSERSASGGTSAARERSSWHRSTRPHERDTLQRALGDDRGSRPGHARTRCHRLDP